MRRSEREVTGLENILAILTQCEIIRLGLCVGDQPYIVPMNYGIETVDGKVFIYFHCASEGKKLDMIAQNHHACFEADSSYRLVTGEAACSWSAEYQSVMGEGTIAIVTEETEKARALDLLMKRYGFPGKPAYKAEALAAVTVLRLAVTSMTGKSKK